jgi:hypothetical protein
VYSKRLGEVETVSGLVAPLRYFSGRLRHALVGPKPDSEALRGRRGDDKDILDRGIGTVIKVSNDEGDESGAGVIESEGRVLSRRRGEAVKIPETSDDGIADREVGKLYGFALQGSREREVCHRRINDVYRQGGDIRTAGIGSDGKGDVEGAGGGEDIRGILQGRGIAIAEEPFPGDDIAT